MSWFSAPQPLLPALLAHHGRWRAGRTALIEGQRRLTWGQLEAATAQIANGLAASGLGRGARIAVLMDNSLELALLLLGILRSGCVAVPLNVSISDTAVAAMIEDAAALAVFASGRHCARIDALATTSARVAAAPRFAHGGPGGTWLELNAWRAAQCTPLGRCSLLTCENVILSSRRFLLRARPVYGPPWSHPQHHTL